MNKSFLDNLNIKGREGFTLLMAVLIASLILSIGISLFNIILKETILSSSARDSQFAFYAADTGIECGLYWDTGAGVFPSTPSIPFTIQCNGDEVPVVVSLIEGGAASSFQLQFSPEDYCANVVVEKTTSGTIIESRGYNTCVIGNPRRIERGLRTRY